MAEIVASGEDWRLENDGTLYVYSDGEMSSYGWGEYRDSIRSVSISNSVTSIASGAFSDCDGFTSVIIPDSVKWIGEQAFARCANLASVTIPASVTSICYEAFYGCDNLADVYYSGSQLQWEAIDSANAQYELMESIGATIHYGTPCGKFILISGEWWRLESDGTLYVYCVGEMPHSAYSYYGWYNYEWRVNAIVMSDSVTSVGAYAFCEFPHLSSVTIPDNVTEIGSSAFRDCPNLTSAAIPESVTEVDYSAFSGCSSLTDVYYAGTREQWAEVNIRDYNEPLLNATIHYKEDSMSTETRNPQRVVYSIVPPDTFNKLILEAGIVVTDFEPATGEYDGFIGATSGGVSFNANSKDVDFGEDMDNAPDNTKQLRRRVHYDPTLTGTLVSADETALQRLIGAADVEDLTSATNAANATETGLTPSPSTAPISSLKRIVPSEDILSGDFIPDLWLIADYTNNHNPNAGAGCVAIRMMNAFNTPGLQLQTQKNQKGTLPFEFHAFYDAEDITAVPFEVYVRNGPIYEAGQ